MPRRSSLVAACALAAALGPASDRRGRIMTGTIT